MRRLAGCLAHRLAPRLRRLAAADRAWLANPLFDGAWYLKTYPDVSDRRAKPYRHYRRHGIDEGRHPNAMFDTDWYLWRHPEVSSRWRDPLAHYYCVGADLGCDPSPRFSTDWYLSRYPDVKASGMNPLLHFLRHGRTEGRAPLPPGTLASKDRTVPAASRQGLGKGVSDRLRQAVETNVPAGSIVVVVNGGDPEMLVFDLHSGHPFPIDGSTRLSWQPADVVAAVREAAARGASHLVVPARALQYPGLRTGLDAAPHSVCRRIYYDNECSIFELAPAATAPETPTSKPTVAVFGTARPDCLSDPSVLADALGETVVCGVSQTWRGEPSYQWLAEAPYAPRSADWIVYVDNRVVVPPGYVDEMVDLASSLGVERAQPAHASDLRLAPPEMAQVQGCVAREMPSVGPMPMLLVRAGARPDGPTALLDTLPVRLAGVVHQERPTPHDLRGVWVRDELGFITRIDLERHQTPEISIVIATYERPRLLQRCLDGFTNQTLSRDRFEIVVIDDGTDDSAVEQIARSYSSQLSIISVRIEHAGRAAAKNIGALVARGRLVLFFDDDDTPASEMLEAYLQGHADNPGDAIAILGHTEWAPRLTRTPWLYYLTDVGGQMFSYRALQDGDVLDWRYFWEGRVSCTRSFLLEHGLHDQRLAYSIDVELGKRLEETGLRVVYRRAAVSHMERAPSLADFCRRTEAKGVAAAQMDWLHPDFEMHSYTKASGAIERWASLGPQVPKLLQRIGEMEQRLSMQDPPTRLEPLWRAYRDLLSAHYVRGAASAKRKRALENESGNPDLCSSTLAGTASLLDSPSPPAPRH